MSTLTPIGPIKIIQAKSNDGNVTKEPNSLVFIQNDKQIWLNGVSYAGTGSSSASSDNIINGSYAEIRDLLDNGKLVPGAKYIIDDYGKLNESNKLIEQPNEITVRFKGNCMQLLLTAIGPNAFDPEVKVLEYAGLDGGYLYYNDDPELLQWRVWYDIHNDSEKYAWALPDGDEDAKGVIYRMIDEFGNEAPYDFKNIQFYAGLIDELDDRSAFMGFNASKNQVPEQFKNFNTFINIAGQNPWKDYYGDDSRWFYTFSYIKNKVVQDGSLPRKCLNGEFPKDKKAFFNNNKIIGGLNVCTGDMISFNGWDADVIGENLIDNAILTLPQNIIQLNENLEALPNNYKSYPYQINNNTFINCRNNLIYSDMGDNQMIRNNTFINCAAIFTRTCFDNILKHCNVCLLDMLYNSELTNCQQLIISSVQNSQLNYVNEVHCYSMINESTVYNMTGIILQYGIDNKFIVNGYELPTKFETYTP